MRALIFLLTIFPMAAASPAQVPEELKDLSAHSGGEISHTAAYWEVLHQAYSWDYGSRGIEWRRREREDATQLAWSSSTNTYSTSFGVSHVAFRAGGDEIFVAGKQSDGDVVIERWTWTPRARGWRHLPPTMQPIGTPMPPYIGTLSVPGGQWAAPPTTHASPTRTVILESSSYSYIRNLEVDPEGRFLLFQDHDDGTLYRIRLDQGAPPSAPEVLFTATQVPALAHTVWATCVDHAATGDRLWRFAQPRTEGVNNGDRVVFMLWDTDNDGQFDSHETQLYRQHRPIYDVQDACITPWRSY